MASHTTPLRVLTVASTYPAVVGDGTPSFVRDLAVGMAHQVETLILVPAVPGGAPHETGDGIHVRRYRFFPRRWEDVAAGAMLENIRSRPSRIVQVPSLLIAQFFAVRRAVREHRPNVIHAHWIVPQGFVVRWAARKTPVVVTTLGGDLYALRDPLSRALKRSALRHARAVTVMNEDMRELVVGLGARPEHTHVRPMGARVADFAAAAAASQASGKSGPVRLIAVGRLVEKKGFHVLLEALASLPPESWELTVVGDGPLRSALEAQASGLPVRFMGQLSRADLAAADARAEIAVFPSVRAESGDQDGLPVALLEAMGSGCAVVVSDLPGLDEAVQHEVSGIVVPSGDPAALSEALRHLIGDPERRARLGREAARRALKYDVDQVARDYAEILARAAATPSA